MGCWSLRLQVDVARRLPAMSSSPIAMQQIPTTWRNRAGALAAEFRLDATIVSAFVVSRVLVVVAALAAEFLIPRNPLLGPGDGSPILKSLTSWDAWYYLGVVREGYHADPVSGLYRDTAFLPLFPIVVTSLFGTVASVRRPRGRHRLERCLPACPGPARPARRAVPRTAALALAAALLAIYPFASVFAMAYTESLFLLVMVGAFVAAKLRASRPASGVLFALACLCRFQGVVLLLLPLGADHASAGWLATETLPSCGWPSARLRLWRSSCTSAG